VPYDPKHIRPHDRQKPRPFAKLLVNQGPGATQRVYTPTAPVVRRQYGSTVPGTRGSLDCWPMRRFEYPPSGVRDRDAANIDDLLARLNGLTLDCCEPAAEEAA
jgi:hypothetical protein